MPTFHARQRTSLADQAASGLTTAKWNKVIEAAKKSGFLL
jgi:hypothetical protein